MGKKAGGGSRTMSMAELNREFGGTGGKDTLPSHSEGKEFGKGKGKGMRDFEDSWERGGKGDREDRGGKGHRRRDDEPSRADKDDSWLRRGDDDRGGGGRFGGGGGAFGGDRDRDRGDRPPRRDDRRREDDAGVADNDTDWRSGPRRAQEESRGGGGRDFNFRRDGGGGGGGAFGSMRDRGDDRRDDDRRPRLNLKPRSKDLPGGEPMSGARDDDDARPSRSDPFGGARPAASKADDRFIKSDDALPPWNRKKAKADEDDDDEEAASDKEEKKEETKKWVPPALKRKQEEEKQRQAEEDARRREDRFSDHRRPKDDDDRRPDDRRDRDRDKGFEEVLPRGGGGGRYVPPGQRAKEAQEQKKIQEAQQQEKQEKQQKAEAEKEKKREAAERKAKEEAEKKEKKEAAKKAAKATKEEATNKENAPAWDDAKVEAFAERCQQLVADDDDDAEDLASEVTSLLTEAELKSIAPTRALLNPLMRSCRRKDENEVVAAVGRVAPVLSALIENSQTRRFKVRVLCEAQRIAFEMKLPIISPSATLLESIFDGLYQAEVIEEQYYGWWAEDDKDETPGKLKAMFQLSDFLEFLKTAKFEGDDDDDEEDMGEGSEEEDDEDDEEEEDDVEANVPRSRGR